MKLNQSTEQGVYVVIILALQKDHHPLKSSRLAELLHVSDSYLKKILRKLVVANVITSEASKDGGFTLAKPVSEISLNDIYSAIQGGVAQVKFSHIGDRVFDDVEHVRQGEVKITTAIQMGDKAFRTELDKIKLSEMIHEDSVPNGAIDWEKQIKE